MVARDGVADERKAFASHAVQEARGIGPEGVAIRSVWLPLPEEELGVWPAVPEAVLRVLNLPARLVRVDGRCRIRHPPAMRYIALDLCQFCRPPHQVGMHAMVRTHESGVNQLINHPINQSITTCNQYGWLMIR